MARTRSFIAGSIAVAGCVAILGLLIPNTHLVRVGFFWSPGWELRLWVVVSLASTVGFVSGALLGLVFWYRQRRTLRQCLSQRRMAEGELHELRRLLTQKKTDAIKD